MSPKVSIIILNWNGVGDTLPLLKNLEEVLYDNFSVLVVDNASTDDSLGEFARYIERRRQQKSVPYPLSLLPLSENFGFAEGNNKGVVQALRESPDYLLFLNNDTVVSPTFLTELVAAAETDQRLAAVAPLIYYASPSGAKTKKVWFAGGWLNFYAGGGHHRVELPEQKSVISTEFLTGCCLLLRRTALQKVSVAFDPKFFAYGEDVDLSLRLTKAGYTLALAPEATIWHKLAASSGGTKSSNFWYYNVRNNFLVMARYATWYQWPVFILYFLFYKPVLISVVGAILRPRPDKWQRLKAITQATGHALTGRYGKRP